jgi:hypothetical protein
LTKTSIQLTDDNQANGNPDGPYYGRDLITTFLIFTRVKKIMKRLKQQKMSVVFCDARNSNNASRSQAVTAQLLVNGIKGVKQSGGKFAVAVVALLAMMFSLPAYANTVYSQAPLGTGTTQLSYADAAAMDMGYVFYDNFTTTSTQTGSISNITWQGQDNPNTGFTIVILNAQPSAPDTTGSASILTVSQVN